MPLVGMLTSPIYAGGIVTLTPTPNNDVEIQLSNMSSIYGNSHSLVIDKLPAQWTQGDNCDVYFYTGPNHTVMLSEILAQSNTCSANPGDWFKVIAHIADPDYQYLEVQISENTGTNPPVDGNPVCPINNDTDGDGWGWDPNLDGGAGGGCVIQDNVGVGKLTVSISLDSNIATSVRDVIRYEEYGIKLAHYSRTRSNMAVGGNDRVHAFFDSVSEEMTTTFRAVSEFVVESGLVSMSAFGTDIGRNNPFFEFTAMGSSSVNCVMENSFQARYNTSGGQDAHCELVFSLK